MNAPQMVAHLAEAMRMAIGDRPVPLRRTPFCHPVLEPLLIHVLPMPYRHCDHHQRRFDV
jgi:hypothetical protein